MILQYTWDFTVIIDNGPAILRGLLITAEISFLSLVFGTILGLTVGICKLLKNTLIKYLASAFTEIFSTLPLLVLLIWLFYALPVLVNIRIPAMPTAILGFSLNLAAFSAEIFRAGIESIPKGQIEASTSLGLTRIQTMRRIVLPQAIKTILPPLAGRYIETIKLTSLATVISVNELLHTGQNLISVSFRPLEVYSVIAIAYLAIILPLSLTLKRFEKTHEH